MFGRALPEGRFSSAEINAMLSVYETLCSRSDIVSDAQRYDVACMIIEAAQIVGFDRETLLRAVNRQAEAA